MAGRDDLPLLEPANRRELRAWLAENHASARGVWVAIGKKGTDATELRYDAAVEEALCFGWIDSVAGSLDDARYKQLLTPRKARSMWSASNKKRVAGLIAEGCMAPAGLAAIEAAKANGSWNTLDEIDALVVPDDVREALAAEPGALEGFEGLTESRRKMALFWIASAKRPETRARRLAETVAAAAAGKAPR